MGFFSYNPEAATVSAKDKVRAALMDTVDSGHILDDADIELLISVAENDLNRAIALCARAAAAKVSKDDKVQGYTIGGAGGLSITKTNRASVFLDIARRYEKMAEAGEPFYDISSYDYEISDFGEDKTEYVGDDTDA